MGHLRMFSESQNLHRSQIMYINPLEIVYNNLFPNILKSSPLLIKTNNLIPSELTSTVNLKVQTQY